MGFTEDELHILNEMIGSSDRAGAIVGAAFLEDKILTAISSRLVNDKNTIDKLFKPGKPIGTLSVKAELGYLMGIYSEATRDEILKVAWIRNRFAHWTEPVSFGLKIIERECHSLELPERFAASMIPDYKAPEFDSAGHPPGYWAKYRYAHFIDTMATLLYGAAKDIRMKIP